MELKKLAILGSTGSIGVSTLEVAAAHPDRYRVVSLAAARSVDKLARQTAAFRPAVAAVMDQDAAQAVRNLLPANSPTKVVWGPTGYLDAALGVAPDLVVSAMVGAAGLVPTFAAVQAGIDVALANKETLVAAGRLVMEAAERSGSSIIPVDSEHSALFQALMGNERAAVERLWLTASGGPFRKASARDLARVTPALALDHPNWAMGPKITVDSATLMNKGLEVIEAHWLFGQPYEKISVVIHPQSIVHSLVEYVDGSLMAQMGLPDMKLPIAFALAWPRRLPLSLPRLKPTDMTSLTFEEPDRERFPALELAYRAGRAGGGAPAVMNAANEVAVARFLAGGLDFPGIVACAAAVLDQHDPCRPASVAEVLETDRWARRRAAAWLDRRGEAA